MPITIASMGMEQVSINRERVSLIILPIGTVMTR
jgi:hypothetical protein